MELRAKRSKHTEEEEIKKPKVKEKRTTKNETITLWLKEIILANNTAEICKERKKKCFFIIGRRQQERKI